MIIKAHENPKLTVLIILRIIPMAINMIPMVLIAFLQFLLSWSSGFKLSLYWKIHKNVYFLEHLKRFMKRNDLW